MQALEGNQPSHELYLVDAQAEKKPRELRQCLFAQVSASVEIVPARQVAGCQLRLVGVGVARKPPCDRPDATGVECVPEHGVRHHAGDPPVAIQKRMDPEEAVMGSGGGHDRVRRAKAAVDGLEPVKETRHRAGADRGMPTHPHVAFAKDARDNGNTLLRVWLFDPAQCVREQLAKSAMGFREAGNRHRAILQAAAVDPFLDFDMGLRLKLEIALFGLGAVVALERAFDVNRMDVVPLDQVAVVAVHRADERGEPHQHAVRQAAPESGRPDRQFDDQIGEFRAVLGSFGNEQGTHPSSAFAVVLSLAGGRRYDRIHGRFVYYD